MPSQRATTHLGPNGQCDACGQLHHTVHGKVSCAGHVRFDRDPQSPTYRAPLPQPRPCRRDPRPGLERCPMHGAASKNSAAAGKRRVTEQKAAQVLRRFGEPVDTTPTEALLDAVKWTAGYVAWLRDKVAGVGEDPDGKRTVDEQHAAETKALVQYARDSGQIVASVWVDLLGQWHDRLVRICTEAIRAGIEERRVRIAEQQGQLVADVIRKILDRLQLTPEQVATAGEVVPLELRRLAG